MKTLASILDNGLRNKSDTALCDGERSFTFEDVNSEVEKIVDILTNKINPLDRIIVLAEKKVETIFLAIAIWKCGGVYCPIDVDLPEERRASIVNNIQPAMVLSPSNLFDLLTSMPDVLSNRKEIGVEDAAIIIHTSGSTGTPKGVVLSHMSVVSYMESHSKVFDLNSDSRCFNTASFHYDVSIQDTFMPLYLGAYVYINNNFFIPSLILPVLKNEKISHLTIVSSVLTLITLTEEELKSFNLDIRSISTGAELCEPETINTWINSIDDLLVVNGYGPSEVNSATVSYKIRKDNAGVSSYYPIGFPNEGVLERLISDKDEVISLKNKRGELVLGGNQIMMGYWSNPGATERAFIFIDGNKYYKTGDVCSYNDEGALVYHERLDFEVKINGRRINLLEISRLSSEILDIPSIKIGAVKNNNTTFIYLLIYSDDLAEKLFEDGIDRLLNELKIKFPDYMIPKVVVLAEDLKITASGKFNHKYYEDLIRSNNYKPLIDLTNEFSERHFV